MSVVLIVAMRAAFSRIHAHMRARNIYLAQLGFSLLMFFIHLQFEFYYYVQAQRKPSHIRILTHSQIIAYAREEKLKWASRDEHQPYDILC